MGSTCKVELTTVADCQSSLHRLVTSIGCESCSNVDTLMCCNVCVIDTAAETPVHRGIEDEAGLLWDAICFVFLILMIRICKSWYFQHVVVELQLNKEFAHM